VVLQDQWDPVAHLVSQVREEKLVCQVLQDLLDLEDRLENVVRMDHQVKLGHQDH